MLPIQKAEKCVEISQLTQLICGADIEVNFPIPERTDLPNKQKDRIKKIMVGLVYAEKFNPTHIMKVDADDYVSKHLAEMVERNPECNGWFFDRGYEYQAGKKYIYYRKKGFYMHCGTSHIIKHESLKALHESLEQFNNNVNNFDLKKSDAYLVAAHHKTKKIMEKRGKPMKPLSFPGAIYIIKTGENDRDRSRSIIKGLTSLKEANLLAKEIYRNFKSKPLNKSIKEEFYFD